MQITLWKAFSLGDVAVANMSLSLMVVLIKGKTVNIMKGLGEAI